jgi:hypothetical protein
MPARCVHGAERRARRGSGGREHALACKLRQSPGCGRLRKFKADLAASVEKRNAALADRVAKEL